MYFDKKTCLTFKAGYNLITYFFMPHDELQQPVVPPFELPHAHEQPDFPVNVLYIFLPLITAAVNTINATTIFPNINYLH